MIAEFRFKDWLQSMMGLRLLTVSTLAASCGVDVSTAHRWFKGTHQPKGKHVSAIANALGVSESEVYAAISGKGGAAVEQWQDYVASIQKSWADTWKVSVPPGAAERFFELVAEVCAQPVDLRQVAQEYSSQFTVHEALEATIVSAVRQLSPESLSELTNLVETIQELDLETLQELSNSTSLAPGERRNTVVAWLRSNPQILQKLVSA